MAAPSAPFKHRLIRQWMEDDTIPTSVLPVSKSALNRWVDFLKTRENEDGTVGVKLLEADRTDFVAWRNHLAESKVRGKDLTLSPATVNGNLNRVRAFYRWADEVAQVLEVRNPTITVKGLELGEGDEQKTLAEEDYQALLDACQRHTVRGKLVLTFNGKRDKAILALLRTTGMRRAEICGLNLEDYKAEAAKPYLQVGTARQKTKTKRNRRVVLQRAGIIALENYLDARGDGPGPLFVSQSSKTGRLSPIGVTQIIERLRMKAGIDERIGVHSFRRAYAIAAKKADVSDGSLMAQCGWSSNRMVALYTRPEEFEIAHDEILEKMDPKTTRPMRPQPNRYKKGKAA